MTALLSALPTSVVHPLLLGMNWMDPEWLLSRFGSELFYISLVIIFIECGLFFPFLPGDTLLFAMGLFIATSQVEIVSAHHSIDLAIALAGFFVAGLAGNVAGYEIGRAIGPPLYERDGRFIKRKYFDQTEAFFARHGTKALVIGRFVPFVRTFITIVAGVTRMPRRRFILASTTGALLWVLSITLLGYFLGTAVPWLQHNIDYAILVILAFTLLPLVFEWWRHKRNGESLSEALGLDEEVTPDSRSESGSESGSESVAPSVAQAQPETRPGSAKPH